jgi:hypothetical protein
MSSPNGCTGIPWRTRFEDCCDQHDVAYEQGSSRRDADWILRRCITVKGMPVRAWIVWFAVRLVGWYFWRRS